MIQISQEPDHIPRRPLAYSAIIIGVSIVASIVVVVLLAGRHLRLATLATPNPPARIETSVFQVPTDAEHAVRAASEHLNAWGWADRSGQKIHVPLDVATELYLRKEQVP